MKNYFISIMSLMSILLANAHASEDYFMVSNGQGISSPSFWNGLNGHNPAGIVHNQSFKLQLGAGSYSYGSGGILMGNGLLGAGVEFQKFSSNLGYGSAREKINWGLAGHIETLRITLGVSSHVILDGGIRSYDFGVIIDASQKVRLGFILPNFTRKLNIIGAGVTYQFQDSVEIVIDADCNTSLSLAVVKPGISYHGEWYQFTAAYGLRYIGDSSELLLQGLSAGLGVKVVDALLISYEYRGVPEHRLGLTLRFN